MIVQGLGFGVNKRASSGGFKPKFLLRQDFNTLQAAPISTPQAGEIGSINVIQNDGNFAITADGLVINITQATPVWGDLAIVSPAGITRQPGMAISGLWGIPTAQNMGGILFGFRSNVGGSFDNTIATMTWSAFGREIYTGGVLQRAGLNYPVGGETILTAVLRPTGAFFIQNERLFAVGYDNSSATVYPFATYFNPTDPQLKYLRVGLIPSIKDDNLILHRDTTPTNGDIVTAEQDSLHYITWTPTAADVLDIMFRYVDDNNTMIARASQAGTVALIRKIGGVETSIASSAHTFNVGTPYRLGLRYDDNRPCFFISGTRLEPVQAFNSHIKECKLVGTTANLSNWDIWRVDLPPSILSQYTVFNNPFLS